MERNWGQTVQRLQLARRNYHEPADRAIFKELLRRGLNLKGPARIQALEALFPAGASDAALEAYVSAAYKSSRLCDEQVLKDVLSKSADQLRAMRDPFVDLAMALEPAYRELKEVQNARKGALDTLFC